MTDKLRPGACPNHLALNPREGLNNCTLGMDLAERLMDIPKVLLPDDLNSSDVDELSVMTYISYFCSPGNDLLLQWIRRKIPERNIKNFATDWNNGINLGALAEACFSGVCPDWESMEPTDAIANLGKLIALIKSRLGIEPPVSAAELANPEVDEIVVATYLSQFRNAKLHAAPEEFSLRVPSLPKGSAIVHEPISFGVDIAQQASDLAKDIKVTAHGPSSDTAVKISQRDGNLVATFVPTEAGTYEVFAAFQGEHISGSPFSLPVADPSKCQIFGDIPKDMQTGQPETFQVKTRGAGKAKLTCTFDEKGKTSTPVIASECEEQENDQYEVTLQPSKIGDTLVEPKWAGVYIPQAPFRVNICDASKCSVSGPVLKSGKGKVGEPIELTLIADPSMAGKSKPTIKPRGPSAFYTPDVKNKGDNKYEVNFVPWEVGPHEIDVMWGGGHVPKSPFKIKINPAPDANTCSATGKGLKRAIAQAETTFDIIAPEKGLLKKDNGLDVKIAGMSHSAPVEMTDNNDGVYKVSYVAPEPGAYIIEVKFYGKQIPGSPFKLEVVPPADAARCRAYGPALHPNSLHIAGTPLDMFVDTQEAGRGELQVTIKGPDDAKPKVYIANDKGVYSLKWDVREPGKYNAHVWWSQVPIPGSPFKIRVHPGPNAGMVKAFGPGLEPSFEVGQISDFTVETKNAGIGTLTIRVHGIKGAFKIDANPAAKENQRTMKATYDPKQPGDYIIAIRWSGTNIPGSPFKINIRGPPKEKKEKKKKQPVHRDDDEDDILPEQVDMFSGPVMMGGRPGPMMVYPGGYPTGGQVVTSTKTVTTKTKTKGGPEVRIQDEPTTMYYEKKEDKKKKKRKF